MRFLVGALVVTASFAGCLGMPDGSPIRGEAVPPASPLATLLVPANSTGCAEVVIVRPVEPEHARSLLPPGFTAGDASAFFGFPPESGDAFVGFATIRCDRSEIDGAPIEKVIPFVYVEPPRVNGLELEPRFDDMYLGQSYWSSPAGRAVFASAGWTTLDATLEHAFATDPPLSPRATASVADEEGEFARFEVVAPAPRASTVLFRFWSQSADGLMDFELERAETLLLLGAVAPCRLREGSPPAVVLGVTDCSDAVGGIFRGPFDDLVLLHFLPGARAET